MGTGKSWTQLKDVPISYISSIIQPVYIHQDDHEIILIFKSNSNILLKYEIQANKYRTINCKQSQLSKAIVPSSMVYNSLGNTIIVADCYNGICVEMDLNANQSQYEWNSIPNDDEMGDTY